MLTLVIPPQELYDERQNSFIYIKKEKRLTLEHSLLSVAKWESKWKLPFLEMGNPDNPDPERQFTDEQIVDYIRCMTIDSNVDEKYYAALSTADKNKVIQYINSPRTATKLRKSIGHGSSGERDSITSEFIYYYMDEYKIPYETQKWHLSRLLTLIQIHNLENENASSSSNKRSAGEISRMNAIKNQARRKAMHTKG